MKRLNKTVLTVAIGLAALLFTSNVNAQLYSSGNNTISGNNVGIGNNSPTALLHLKQIGGSKSNPIPPSTQNVFEITSAPQIVAYQFPNIPIMGPSKNLFTINQYGYVSGSENAGGLRLQTDNGYLRFGAFNTSFFHFITDRSRFYFNKNVTINGSISAYSTNNLLFQTNSHSSTKATIEHSTGNFILHGGRLIIQNPSGLGSGSNQVALNADGTIECREVEVDLGVIPDYVFAEDYNLMPLAEVKTFIEANKHLPNVKSEAEFKEEGSISLTEMNMKLLEKVEELTLYILLQQEQIENLQTQINELDK